MKLTIDTDTVRIVDISKTALLIKFGTNFGPNGPFTSGTGGAFQAQEGCGGEYVAERKKQTIKE